MMPALTAEKLLAWNEQNSAKWHEFLNANPAILTLTCDIFKTKTVGELLQHIVGAELRYGQRLTGSTETPVSDISYETADALYAAHREGVALMQAALAQPDYDWEEPMTFQTMTMGRVSAPKRALLFHALLHGMRHYAQLATLVRQNGFAPTWGEDYLAMEITPA